MCNYIHKYKWIKIYGLIHTCIIKCTVSLIYLWFLAIGCHFITYVIAQHNYRGDAKDTWPLVHTLLSWKIGDENSWWPGHISAESGLRLILSHNKTQKWFRFWHLCRKPCPNKAQYSYIKVCVPPSDNVGANKSHKPCNSAKRMFPGQTKKVRTRKQNKFWTIWLEKLASGVISFLNETSRLHAFMIFNKR